MRTVAHRHPLSHRAGGASLRRALALAVGVVLALLIAASAFAAIKVGSGKNDRIVGTPKQDDLRGLEGDDRLIGRGGNDLLIGGPGSDVLRGGRRHDQADYRDVGDDVLVDLRRGVAIGGGRDKLVSIRSVSGGPGDDALKGNRQDNTLIGRGGDDRLVGRGGRDTIVAFEGRDVVRAGRGRDHVLSASGSRTAVDCGPGFDSVSAERGDRLENCERVTR
ncbi:hypothetical protein BH24ACT25_BH24ACT25_05630 [soil metagenome]